MSDNKASNVTLHDVDNLPNAVNIESVSQYLRENPMFLVENPEVLMDIQVTLSENGVVSLTQIQTEQYREKVRQLKTQLDSLVNTARQNEHIYTSYAQLNIRLSQVNSLTKLRTVLEEYLLDALNLEAVKLILLDTKNSETVELSEIQQHAIFDKKLAKSPFYLGRLGKLEKQALFADHEANSVALIQICDNPTIGLLAVSSVNAMHFNPKMDTMLLDFLRQALEIHIPRILSADAS